MRWKKNELCLKLSSFATRIRFTQTGKNSNIILGRGGIRPKAQSPFLPYSKKAKDPLDEKMYVKALSTVLGRQMGFNNIDSFVFSVLAVGTHKTVCV